MAEDCNDLKKINAALDSLKNKANLYADVANLKNSKLKEPLKGLVHASAPGKKVSRLGWTLFWVPEPTMASNLVAVPMIVGGKLLDRYYTGTTIKHVGEEARKTINVLQEFFR